MSFESFSRRLLADDRIAVSPPIHAAGPRSNQTYVLAMKDQLLVHKSALATVGLSIAANGTLHKIELTIGGKANEYSIKWVLLTSLLDQIPLPPPDDAVEDVYVYELQIPAGSTIFAVTDALREFAVEHGLADPRKISPNHVPIPANASDNCPYGPPTLTETVFAMPQPTAAPPTVSVAIIDSGFIPPGNQGGDPHWQQYDREFLSHSAPVMKQTTGDQLPKAGTGHHWNPTNSEALSTVTVDDGHGESYEALPALLGHANFVLGLIFQRSAGGGASTLKLELIAHDGSYIEASSDLVTEVTIARSLCKAALSQADVINLSYAFPAYENQPSYVWDTAMALCANNPRPPVVVCPAGNQDNSDARFPAALPVLFATQRDFVCIVGVGSSTPASGPAGWAGAYSNYGTKGGSGGVGQPWVTCACDGSDVVSMFLPIKMALEDAPDGTQYDFTESGVASWTGTCFATAKVSAAICAALAINPALTPTQAWTNVQTQPGAHDDPDHVHYKGTILPL